VRVAALVLSFLACSDILVIPPRSMAWTRWGRDAKEGIAHWGVKRSTSRRYAGCIFRLL
jgi:hypothetical protein